MNASLEGRVALVTGGARDIGRAISMRLAHSGASVVVNYHSSREAAESVVAEILSAGGRATSVEADVTSSEAVRQLVRKSQEAFGPSIHVLVNNAGGMFGRKTMDEMDEEFWDKTVTLNLKSTFLVTKEVLPHMPDHSAIVNMASLAAREGGGKGAIAYAASKGGVLTFTRGLAKELAPRRIRVNVVCAGLIGTRFHDLFTSPEVRRDVASRTAVGREGRPEEVADAVLFLASEASSYISGASIEINGGIYFI